MTSESEPTFQAYHILADTLISAFYDRLAGVTSKRVADQFMVTTAAKVVQKLVGDSPDPVTQMREILSSYHCQIDTTQIGDSTQWTVSCPFAQSVHPKTPSETICPLALLVLGAVRLKEQQSALVTNSLSGDGASFTIKHKS
jgi:hypothetical protein